MMFVSSCPVCQSQNISPLWELPALPLSETYGKYCESFPAYDQTLQYCQVCGHVHLRKLVDPERLYSAGDYHFSTKSSHSTSVRLNSFLSFASRWVRESTKVTVDIGGNDDSLLRSVRASRKIIIDPALNEKSEFGSDCIGIKAFSEEVDFREINPDVVFATHVLEHIASPSQFIRNLLSKCAESTKFIFEVPCFLKQLENARLDAIFHQHYQYFYPATIHRLIESCGGVILGFQYNDYPTCGGSIMFCFQKRKGEQMEIGSGDNGIPEKFKHALSKFHKLIDSMDVWANSKKRVFGFGASLLLPVLRYHFTDDLRRKMVVVLDDDENKAGIGYKNIADIHIANPSQVEVCDGDGILITSLENKANLLPLLKSRYETGVFDGY